MKCGIKPTPAREVERSSVSRARAFREAGAALRVTMSRPGAGEERNMVWYRWKFWIFAWSLNDGGSVVSDGDGNLWPIFGTRLYCLDRWMVT